MTKLILGVLLTLACTKTSPPADKPAAITPSANPPSAIPKATPPPAPAAEKVEEMGYVPEAKETIGGKIVLPAARKGDVKKGDTMFLIARRAGGMTGTPLA